VMPATAALTHVGQTRLAAPVARPTPRATATTVFAAGCAPRFVQRRQEPCRDRFHLLRARGRVVLFTREDQVDEARLGSHPLVPACGALEHPGALQLNKFDRGRADLVQHGHRHDQNLTPSSRCWEHEFESGFGERRGQRDVPLVLSAAGTTAESRRAAWFCTARWTPVDSNRTQSRLPIGRSTIPVTSEGVRHSGPTWPILPPTEAASHWPE
jgi:hypothetical protein